VSFANLKTMYIQSKAETQRSVARKQRLHERSLRAREGTVMVRFRPSESSQL
jgi:hypothetical protein